MAQYQAIFVKIDGLDEEDVGNPVYLNATTRDEAEDEALALPRPEGTNFVKLILEGQYEGPKLGFAL
jgi:hypothetical protein